MEEQSYYYTMADCERDTVTPAKQRQRLAVCGCPVGGRHVCGLGDLATDDLALGCPVERWDGPYRFRCALGVGECSIHGTYSTGAAVPGESPGSFPVSDRPLSEREV